MRVVIFLDLSVVGWKSNVTKRNFPQHSVMYNLGFCHEELRGRKERKEREKDVSWKMFKLVCFLRH